MALLGIDLGGTKLCFAIFDESGTLLNKEVIALKNRNSAEVGNIITTQILKLINSNIHPIHSIGICVPGIYRIKTGTVWAPNIPGWDDYRLLAEVKKVSKKIPVTIDSDRACYILGEAWQGNAKECNDAIFLAVGTGIGAGIMINGTILRGSNDIAGAIGWLALTRPFSDEYLHCGCFEYYASGEGIAKIARKILKETKEYSGELSSKSVAQITSHDVFTAYENNDPLAKKIIEIGIEFWGMAVANLVSLFNPEKIILGGGVFGPATKLIPQIKTEATKWAQPISIKQVSLEASALGSDAGVYGAGFLALKNSIS
ncbi:MAG: ROK family protein [Ginsengibacter sp.]